MNNEINPNLENKLSDYAEIINSIQKKGNTMNWLKSFKTEDERTEAFHKLAKKVVQAFPQLRGVIYQASSQKLRQQLIERLTDHSWADSKTLVSAILDLRDPYKNEKGIPVPSDEQMQTIKSYTPGSTTLISAVPGAGKTFTLMAIVEDFMYRQNIKPEELTLLSFTTAAAGEMRKRIIDRNPWLANKQLRISTADSFALRVLKFYGKGTAWDARNNRLLTNEKELNMIWDKTVDAMIDKKVIEAARGKFVRENLPDAVNRGRANTWNQNDVKSILAETGLSYKELKTGAEIYANIKREVKGRDFTDLKADAIALLKSDPNVRSQVQKACKLLIVDEYQDNSRLQCLMESLILPKDGIKICAGDPNQAIYDSLGGRLNGFKEEIANGAEEINITTTYRCTKEIADAINEYSENTFTGSDLKHIKVPEQKEKGLVPTVCEVINGTEEIEGLDKAEITMVLDNIQERLQNLKTEEERLLFAKETAILCRTNRQVNMFNEVLNTDRYSLLSKYRAGNGVSYRDVLLNPKNYMLNALMNYAEHPYSVKAFDDLLHATGQLDRDENVSYDYNSNRLRADMDFVEGEPIFEAYQRQLYRQKNPSKADMELTTALTAALTKDMASDVASTFLRTINSVPSEEENLFVRVLNDNGVQKRGWVSFVEDLKRDNSGRIAPEGLEIGTIHSSKGKEWDNVYVPFLGEKHDVVENNPILSNLPFEQQQALVSGEQRVNYVAVTRTRKNLFISYSGNHSRYLEAFKNKVINVKYNAVTKEVEKPNRKQPLELKKTRSRVPVKQKAAVSGPSPIGEIDPEQKQTVHPKKTTTRKELRI